MPKSQFFILYDLSDFSFIPVLVNKKKIVALVLVFMNYWPYFSSKIILVLVFILF
jgi:hypothetical protein